MKMAKKSFLIPVSTALAALVSPAIAETHNPYSPMVIDEKNVASIEPLLNKLGDELMPYQKGNDLFNFVIGKSSTGEVYAYHSSHASHASHASHYSSR